MVIMFGETPSLNQVVMNLINLGMEVHRTGSDRIRLDL